MSNGIYRSHGYDIYDIENCTTVSRTRHDIRKFKHTKVERYILERANKHLAEMRKEFLKSDFNLPNAEKPAEFEMEDYDKAVKESNYPQPKANERPAIPTEDPKEPNIKEEPKPSPKQESSNPETSEDPSLAPTETNTPKDPKPSLAKRRLDTNLDGGYWHCEEQHGRRLRVRTTELEEEEELKDSWDNIIHMEQTQEEKEEDCPK